jgi:ubiquinone/menaquinone biosynthesis C-methylase UbiE
MNQIDLRKEEEAAFHNSREEVRRRDPGAYEREYPNTRFYSVVRKNRQFVRDWCAERARGKRALDYCCGLGDSSLMLAELGAAEVVGIDISEESVRTSRERAAAGGFSDRTKFLVMDAEKTEFPDSSFDVIVCSGVLHHLDIDAAYRELARILKPNGQVLCAEPLAYNPLIQWYRRRTPELRTKWESEHILMRKDVYRALEYFGDIEIKFFNFATIAAVPFRKLPVIFTPLLSLLESIDEIILRIPGFRWQAWMIHYALSKPKKNA